MINWVWLHWLMLHETLLRGILGNLGCSLSAEECIRLMLTMEGLEGPNTQDKAERFMAWTGHHLEDSRPTWVPAFFGILGSTVDTRSCFSSRISLKFTLGRSPLAHVHCVGPGACEGLNTQDQVRRPHGEDWSPPRGHDHWL